MQSSSKENNPVNHSRSRAVATIRPPAANCNAAPLRFLEGETTPRVARLLAEFCSVAAMNSDDRMAQTNLKIAAAAAFDAMANLEAAARRRLAGGAA